MPDVPVVSEPVPNNNQHSADENLRLGHYLEGVKTFIGLLIGGLFKSANPG